MLEANSKSMPAMRPFDSLKRWSPRSLATQFLVAGGLVSILAMVVTGFLVKSQIERGVTRNSAAATALYVDSIIAPLLPDMQTSQMLDDSAAHALDETLAQGALGQQLLSFRLWRRDGTILYSSVKGQTGKRFEPSRNLKAAFDGLLVAEFDRVDDPESEKERESGEPLLEIYNPVRQPWSGEVVAVSEFYEVAPDLARDLTEAAIKSWLAVAGATLFFFLILSAIVLRGSRTIDAQSRALSERVAELSALLKQNRALQMRVGRAAQRTAALNERYLRRIGADLHDGPAQLIALAALRLDGPVLSDNAAPFDTRQREALAIKASLDDALEEIRSICNGLVLPRIEASDLLEILTMAVRQHEQRTGSKVALTASGAPRTLSTSAKICTYRFVQEALNNGFRHGLGVAQSVTQSFDDDRIHVEVTDGGPGFDPNAVPAESIGLAGLRDRIESLGGSMVVRSSHAGTRLTMSVGTEDIEPL